MTMDKYDSEKKFVSRSTEILRVVSDRAWWEDVKFHQLKKGDIFRLWDSTEEGKRVPDYTRDGHHDVCVCLTDAKPHVSEGGKETYIVDTIPVRGVRSN